MDGHENSNYDLNYDVYPMWSIDLSDEMAPPNAEQADRQQYQPYGIHQQQAQTSQEQYLPRWLEERSHCEEQPGQTYCQEAQPHQGLGQLNMQSLPARPKQGPLSHHQTGHHPAIPANQQKDSAMGDKIECPGCKKSIHPRSMHNHGKICRKLNPDKDDTEKCILPVFGSDDLSKACNTNHRNKTALRDHQHTVHYHFQPGEPSYEKRDSTDTKCLARFSVKVLRSRVTVEGKQLLEEVDRLNNEELVQNLRDWVDAGTNATKEVLKTRLILIREERQSLGLAIPN